jgi:hypothetical protein
MLPGLCLPLKHLQIGATNRREPCRSCRVDREHDVQSRSRLREYVLESLDLLA